jgi:hypothetical protein
LLLRAWRTAGLTISCSPSAYAAPAQYPSAA